MRQDSELALRNQTDVLVREIHLWSTGKCCKDVFKNVSRPPMFLQGPVFLIPKYKKEGIKLDSSIGPQELSSDFQSHLVKVRLSYDFTARNHLQEH